MPSQASILVVDDDPSHLRIYGWILSAAGFHPVPAQVLADDICLPNDGNFDVVVLDYRLTGSMTAVEAAQRIQQRYPGAPIIVLSDVFGMPEEMAPYARKFVRKGEPEKLVSTIRNLLDAQATSLDGQR